LGTVAAFLLAHVDLRSLCELFLEVISTVTAGVAGMFFLGVFCRRVGGSAALAGLFVNYIACFVMKFGGLAAAWHIHPFLIGGFGLAACLMTGWAVSFVIPRKENAA